MFSWAAHDQRLEQAHEDILASGALAGLSGECQDWLRNYRAKSTFVSQVGQDWFLYVNFFRGKRNGVFLDIGANQPREWSNSFFFEQCLGWTGICVEANPAFAHGFHGTRRCAFENVCISNASEPMVFKPDGYVGHVVGNGGDADAGGRGGGGGGEIVVPCTSIDKLLAKHGITHVDFMSIDIEGFEMTALTPFPSSAPIDVIVMETFWSTSHMRWKMMDNGYWLMGDVGMVDDVFVRMDKPPAAPSNQGSQRHAHYRLLQNTQKQTGACINGKP